MSTIIRTDAVAPPGAAKKARDDLTSTDNEGVLWLTHMGFTYCYPGLSPIPNNSVVKNMVDGAVDSLVLAPGADPIIAGGGIDFSTIDTAGTYLTIPASVAAAVAANGQDFLACFYFKLPTDADFPTFNGSGRPIVNWANTTDYTAQADLLHINMQTSGGTVKQLHFRRQTVIGTPENISYSPLPAGFTGQVCQLSYWRNSVSTFASIRSAAGGRDTRTIVTGADNSETISSLVGKIGATPQWGVFSTDQNNAKKFRFYRGFVEIPGISGRDPLTTIEADWVRNSPEFS